MLRQYKYVIVCGGDRAETIKAVCNANKEIAYIVVPQQRAILKRLENVIEVAINYKIRLCYLGKEELVNFIANHNFDVLISLGWPWLISNEIIHSVKYAVNVHPTLLPKYRGFRSGAYILLNNEKESGVTVHMLTEKMDAGEIICQKSFPLSVFDTPKSLKRKTSMIECGVVVEAIEKIENDEVKLISQNESEATEFNYVRTPKDSFIDWNKPLKDLYNEIRACDPENYPAFFYVNGEKVCIQLYRPDKPEEDSDMI